MWKFYHVSNVLSILNDKNRWDRIISDVHANLAAFEAVLDSAGDFDKIWCLGDMVGYGPDPNKCIARLREFDHICVAGNHDWAVLARLNLTDAAFAPANHVTFHPGRSATLSVGGLEVGVLGEVHPDVCEAHDLGNRCVCLAEFNLEKLLVTVGQPVRMRPISPYPAVYEDVALVVDEDLPASEVHQAIVAAGGQLLRRVELFDVYRGDQLPPGKKSLAFSFTYQAMDRSLTSDQVAEERRRMVQRLERQIGARLRE